MPKLGFQQTYSFACLNCYNSPAVMIRNVKLSTGGVSGAVVLSWLRLAMLGATQTLDEHLRA